MVAEARRVLLATNHVVLFTLLLFAGSCRRGASAVTGDTKRPQRWYAGPATCAGPPAFQVREYAPGLFVFRQPACTNYEKPFLYLLVGKSKALLLDTGAGGIDVATPIDSSLNAWRRAHGGSPRELVVGHTHAHGDHRAGDSQFRNREHVTLIGTDTTSVRTFFGFTSWPTTPVTFDLGGRLLDVLAIPGHEPSSIAVYDRATRLLLTGDTFYPGRLYVRDTAAYARSVARLTAFASHHRIDAILGTHIEQSATPFVDYVVGTKDQPNEDRLELSRAELVTLDSAVQGMRGKFTRLKLPRFTIWP